MKPYLLTLACLFSCAKSEDMSDKRTPDEIARIDYDDTVNRLATDFLDESHFVVSRHFGGEPEHLGDSLIWSGVWLYAAPCDVGSATSAALRSMVADLGGGVYRHPSLPHQASLDGALGLWFGVASRLARCGADEWASTIKLHEGFIRLNDRKINPHSNALAYPEFDYLPQLMAAKVNGSAAPDESRLRTLELEVAAWAGLVKATKAACYRAHLGWLALSTVEALGGRISDKGRNMFCAASDGLDLPVVNNWCGRQGIDEYLASFKFDEWEYRHQRCAGWETPDGNGLRTPGLDRLVALREAYEL